MVVVGSSLAVGAGSSTTFETGTEPFTTLECAHPSTQFVRVQSPVREGSYSARFSETANDVWSNGMVRCLAARYDSGETTGNDYYYHLSIYIPSNGITSNLIWELHHPPNLYNAVPAGYGCGVAPFALHTDGTRLKFRIATGDCNSPAHGWAYWEPNLVIPGLDPYPRNTWIDFVFHIKFAESSTGVVQVYARTGSNAWPASPQISRSNIPTLPYYAAGGIHNVKLYWEVGLYPGGSGYNGNDAIYIDDYRRETSLSAAEGSGGTSGTGIPPSAAPPAPAGAPSSPFTVATNLVNGQTLKAKRGSAAWSATPSASARSVEFWVDGALRWTDSSSPYAFGTSGALDLTGLSAGNHTLVVKATAADGRTASTTTTIVLKGSAPTAGGGAGAAASPSAPASFSVATNLVDGQKLKTRNGPVAWSATPSASARSVEFWVDGALRSTDSSSPYIYSATGVLDPAGLSEGGHTLVVKATAADGRTASTSIAISVRGSAAESGGSSAASPSAQAGSSSPSVSTFSVATNLGDGQRLKTRNGPVVWSATPSASASSIEFWVDGALRWTDSSSPYVYSATGMLDPAGLSEGAHALVVKATAADGRTASTTIAISVR